MNSAQMPNANASANVIESNRERCMFEVSLVSFIMSGVNIVESADLPMSISTFVYEGKGAPLQLRFPVTCRCVILAARHQNTCLCQAYNEKLMREHAVNDF
jgi:uncharacterized paraquat-inducible protein A